MTTLPGPVPSFVPQSSSGEIGAGQAVANFGQLVQKIVQSNSGKHRALVPVPRKEREDHWGEYRTMAERAQTAKNFAHAEGMWLKAIAEGNSFDHRDWRRAYSCDCLATLYFAEERYDEAEVFAVRALEATKESYGENHLKTAECAMFLAAICFHLKRPDEAVEHAQAALSIYETQLGDWNAKVATACYNLAVLYHSFGDFDLAEVYYQRAFKVRAKVFGWEHEATTRISKAYSEMTVDRKHHKEAKEILDRLIGPAV